MPFVETSILSIQWLYRALGYCYSTTIPFPNFNSLWFFEILSGPNYITVLYHEEPPFTYIKENNR